MVYFKNNVKKRKSQSMLKWAIYAVVLIAALFFFVPRMLINRAFNIINEEIPENKTTADSVPKNRIFTAYNFLQVAKHFPTGEKRALEGQKMILDFYFPLFKADYDRVLNNPKIEVLFEHNTLQLTGDGKVQGADLVYRKGEHDEQLHHIDIDGFFLAIGHHPNTQLFRDQLELDAEGYLKVAADSQACLGAEGVFAAGDCCDPHYRQAIVAAGSGCKAAIDADKYLKTL